MILYVRVNKNITSRSVHFGIFLYYFMPSPSSSEAKAAATKTQRAIQIFIVVCICEPSVVSCIGLERL